jgi:hypothetical protein
MSSPPKAPEMPVLVGDPLAPDIFVDEAAGFYLLGGNVRVTFSTWRVDHEQSPSAAHRVVICRLVMPVGQAEALVKGLGDFLGRMRAPPE